jgi:VanZ family protein
MTRHQSASPRTKRLAIAACVLAWIGAFVATHIPLEQLPPNLPGSDKTLHLLGYGALGLIFWLTLRVHGCGTLKRITLVLGILAIYGLFDEATQPLVNRCFAWSDWRADIVGAALAVGLCEPASLLHRRRAD